jgi:hypothetical protein
MYSVEITKGRWFKDTEYVDLKTPDYTWKIGNRYFSDCKTPNKERAEEVYNNLAGKYTILKESIF